MLRSTSGGRGGVGGGEWALMGVADVASRDAGGAGRGGAGEGGREGGGGGGAAAVCAQPMWAWRKGRAGGRKGRPWPCHAWAVGGLPPVPQVGQASRARPGRRRGTVLPQPQPVVVPCRLLTHRRLQQRGVRVLVEVRKAVKGVGPHRRTPLVKEVAGSVQDHLRGTGARHGRTDGRTEGRAGV